jgi:hypothetical protein
VGERVPRREGGGADKGLDGWQRVEGLKAWRSSFAALAETCRLWASEQGRWGFRQRLLYRACFRRQLAMKPETAECLDEPVNMTRGE